MAGIGSPPAISNCSVLRWPWTGAPAVRRPVVCPLRWAWTRVN